MQVYALFPDNPITLKDKDRNPIQNYMGFRFDRDLLNEGVQELKEWMALLNYLPSMGTSIPSTIYGPGGAIENRIEIVNY